MIKKVVMICVAVMLVTVLAGVASGIQISSTSNPSTASPPKNLQFASYTGPVVGSKNSDVYHYPSCSEAKKIKPENLVTFPTIADACAAGYRPCKVCDPPACGTPTPTATPTAKPTAAPTAASTPQQQLVTSPTPTSTPKPSTATPTTVSASASNGQASAAASSSSTPGFEAAYALGALAAAFLAISAARRR
jgi:hypothetical protein